MPAKPGPTHERFVELLEEERTLMTILRRALSAFGPDWLSENDEANRDKQAALMQDLAAVSRLLISVDSHWHQKGNLPRHLLVIVNERLKAEPKPAPAPWLPLGPKARYRVEAE